MRPKSVCVFHPGTQHAYQTALAFQKTNLLALFATSIYYKPNKLSARLLGVVPFGDRLINTYKRRHHPDIDPDLVLTIGWWEWIETLSRRMEWQGIAEWANFRGNSSFASEIVGAIQNRGAEVAWGYNTSSLEAFRRLRQLGVKCYLDQTIGHPLAWNQIYCREAEIVGVRFDPLARQYSQREIDIVNEENHLADRVLCGSRFAAATMLDGGTDERKLAVINYGVDTELFMPSERRSFEGSLNLLFVGSFGLRKGAYYILQALRQLRTLSKLTLKIVGHISVQQEFLSGLSDVITVVPHISRLSIHKAYCGSDVLILPSLFEGSSLVTYEALASGLPVITTKSAGSIVRNRIDGLIVNEANVDTLVEAIVILYNDIDLRREMAANARQRALKFSWEHYSVSVNEVLNDSNLSNNPF